MKCDNCVYLSAPEMIIQNHYLKDRTYCETRIVSRCLATPHKYVIGCVCCEQYCVKKEK